VVCGDARQLPALVDPSAHGLCGLVLTSPPYGPSVHGQVTTRPGAGIRKAHWRYSTDPANLAHVGLDRLLAAMRDVLTGSARGVASAGGAVALARVLDEDEPIEHWTHRSTRNRSRLQARAMPGWRASNPRPRRLEGGAG
jgi:hypothetical protein